MVATWWQHGGNMVAIWWQHSWQYSWQHSWQYSWHHDVTNVSSSRAKPKWGVTVPRHCTRCFFCYKKSFPITFLFFFFSFFFFSFLPRMSVHEDVIEYVSPQDMYVQVKGQIHFIAECLKEKISEDIVDKMRFDADFTISSFFSAYRISRAGRNVFHSSYQDEILKKTRIALRDIGYSSDIVVNNETGRIYYTSRVIPFSKYAKKVFSVVFGLTTTLILFPYIQSKMQEMRDNDESLL
jgi:hypothetical protein